MIVSIILLIVGWYLLAGLCFAIPFVSKGAEQIDEGAKGGSLGFKLIILPGTMVFWPLLLKKWMQTRRQH